MSIQKLKSRKSLLAPRAMRGFTLLEMAMVLAIIGLIMGTILSMTKTLTTSSKISATQSKEALIKAALINFIATNNRLPCPADPTPAQLTGANAGTEAITAGVCTIAPNGLVVTGVVPWVLLGLTQDAATDGYNQFFTYQVTLTATQTVAVTAQTIATAGTTPPTTITTPLGRRTISGLRGDISIFSATPIKPATSLLSLGNQTNYCTPTGTTVNPCATVAIIVSHGADLYGAFTTSGQNLPTTVDELENANKDSNFVMHDASMNSLNPFDDIILPLSVNDLLSSFTNNGTLQTNSALLNSNFASITAAISANTISNRTGSVGASSYAVLMNAGVLGLLLPSSAIFDPWGNPIQFNNGTPVTSITCATAPTTIVFSLTSYGPDGVSGGGDDITVKITVNQFLPLLIAGGC